jgi:hypothetical protein
MYGSPGLKSIFLGCFTDRDHGEGFVLSAFRLASRAGESKHIKTNRINSAGNGCVKCKLFCMCENIGHDDKQYCKLDTNV